MRWRHRKVEFIDPQDDPLEDMVLYSNGAQPPDMIVVLATYSETGGAVDYDRLVCCTLDELPDGVTVITGISDHLLTTVGLAPEDAGMTIHVHPNDLDCRTCN